MSDYVEEHGHAVVPTTEVTETGFRLGAWVSQQRVRYLKGKLSADRVARLEDFPVWLWRVH